MINDQHISVVIPALNEELAISKVITGLKQLLNKDGGPLIDDIVVCDNGSTDATAKVASNSGARVVYQPIKGYGIACLTAIEHLHATDIVLFIDGDDSCDVSQAVNLIKHVSRFGSFDIAIGSRSLGQAEAGALTRPQEFGNKVATTLIKFLWHRYVSDLGPFRAIRFQALKQLRMQDRRFGWTVEMQIKAIQRNLNMIEVPVDSKRRIGTSKISGTFRGVIGAGFGILGKIASLWWQEVSSTRYSKAIIR